MDSQETQSQETTNKFDGIEEALDVMTDIVPAEKPAVEKVEEVATSTKEQLKKDYEYTLSLIHI